MMQNKAAVEWRASMVHTQFQCLTDRVADQLERYLGAVRHFVNIEDST